MSIGEFIHTAERFTTTLGLRTRHYVGGPLLKGNARGLGEPRGADR